MLNLICKLIAKIVFTGVNGTICIPILIALFPEFMGQVKDIAYVSKKHLKEGISMPNLEKLDFIKIVDFNREELKEEEMKSFIGAEGIIINTFGDSGHRHDVVFFDMELQKKSMDSGGLLWRDEDLEKLEIEV